MIRLSWSWLFKWSGYKQMKLTIVRVDITDHGIFGHLSCDGNPFNCLTLEHHDIDIPEGTYKVTIYKSPEHGLIPLLNGVPGRNMIEIHEGNWEANSKGCILVGKDRTMINNKEGINQSKDTLKGLMSVLNGCDDISVTIR
jgi:hypothetical protein